MQTPLTPLLDDLSSLNAVVRESAAAELFRLGRSPADRAVHAWWADTEFSELLDPDPNVTVGLAVTPIRFARIHVANDSPPLVHVPPDQDAREFELHFPDRVQLDILTTKEPSGSGAIAKFLGRFGEGVQQVEFRCKNVDRATQILKDRFGLSPIYPATRAGANHTRINFFLVSASSSPKVLVELYEPAPRAR